MSQSHSTGAGGGSISKQTPHPINAAVHRATGQPGLTRYDSAPGSLLSRVADSIIAGAGDVGFRTSIGSDGQLSRFFPRESQCLATNSSFKAAAGVSSDELEIRRIGKGGSSPSMCLGQPFDLDDDGAARDLAPGATAEEARTEGSHLMRQHSSPAGFFSHLMVDNGFASTRGTRNYFQPTNEGNNTLTGRRLRSQLSFSRQDAVSQISEISIPEMGESSDEAGGNVGHSYMPNSYTISSWDDTNSIVFNTTNKHSRDNNGDIISSLNNIDSQQYGIPGTSLDMSAVDKLLHIQQDSVPFKIRAKRGCATHPRSIAERERRTRISEKLRKLQDIVPNMDKQTSTSDMLDLAVQHIKGLQSQIQILKQEQESCACVSNGENL